MEKFIKRYLTPKGRFKVLGELVEYRYQTMVKRMKKNKSSIIRYIQQMSYEDLKKTRFYFYVSLKNEPQLIFDKIYKTYRY